MRSSAIRVTAPDGSEWVVARRWIPRWAAMRIRRSVGERLRRRNRNRKRDEKDAETGSGTRWYDFLDIPSGGGGCLDELAILAVALVVIAAVWFLVIPLLVLVVDLLIAIGLVLIVGVTRVLFRRPWVVEAHGPDDLTVRRLVVGWRASGDEVQRLGTEITLGIVTRRPPSGGI